jgi:hypothetical protein
MGQCLISAAGASFGQNGRQRDDHVARLDAVALQGPDHVGFIDGPVVLVPAPLISDHRDGCIVQLCFARQFRLWHVGHANQIAAPASLYQAFGAGGKLRTFHRQIGVAIVDADAGGAGGGDAGCG